MKKHKEAHPHARGKLVDISRNKADYRLCILYRQLSEKFFRQKCFIQKTNMENSKALSRAIKFNHVNQHAITSIVSLMFRNCLIRPKFCKKFKLIINLLVESVPVMKTLE